MNSPIPVNEAEKIYYSIFNRKIPASVQEHFEALSKKIESHYPEEEVNKYFESINKIADLEALEVASRYIKKLPVLSQKFLIMVYLAEARSENYKVFVNEKPGFVRACISLISSVLRTGYKAAKGIVILTVNKI